MIVFMILNKCPYGKQTYGVAKIVTLKTITSLKKTLNSGLIICCKEAHLHTCSFLKALHKAVITGLNFESNQRRRGVRIFLLDFGRCIHARFPCLRTDVHRNDIDVILSDLNYGNPLLLPELDFMMGSHNINPAFTLTAPRKKCI